LPEESEAGQGALLDDFVRTVFKRAMEQHLTFQAPALLNLYESLRKSWQEQNQEGTLLSFAPAAFVEDGGAQVGEIRTYIPELTD
jgi:hypothetical protein